MINGFDVSIEFKTIQKGKDQIQTYTIGNGPNVIFSLPPFPHSGLIYSMFVIHHEEFAKKFKLISFDLPGWIGMTDINSKDSVAESVEMDFIVELSKAVLKEYKVKDFDLLGYSFGASVAVSIANKMPNRIKKIGLVSAVLKGDLTENTNDFKKISLIDKLNLHGAGKVYLKNRMKKYVSALRDDGIPDPFLQWYQAMAENIDTKSLLESIKLIFKGDFTEELRNLPNVPILVVNSKNETKYFRDQARYIRNSLEGEASIYLTGQHEDFVLHPKKRVVKQLMSFYG